MRGVLAVSRLVCIMVVFLALAALAGSANARKLGFYAGGNFANLGHDADLFGQQTAFALESELGGNWSASKGTRNGLLVGAYLVEQAAPRFALQLEMEYAQRGTSYDLTGTDGFSTVSMDMGMHLDYLDFALLARPTLSNAGGVRPILLIGPVLGVKVGSHVVASVYGQSASEDISDGMKSVHLGGAIGAGLEIPAGRTTAILLQGRYLLGFSNLLDDENYKLTASDLSLRGGIELKLSR